MAKEQEIREIFRGVGLKLTRQRAAIFKILSEGERSYTAEQLYSLARQEDLKISISTIYRALEQLIRSGLVAKTTTPDGTRGVYALADKEHRHYLICTGCNRMEPLAECPLASFEKQLEAQTCFRISSHRLEIHGLCPDCQKGKAAE